MAHPKRRPGRPKGSKNNPDRKFLLFRQSELERSIRAMKAQGLTVGRIEIDPRSGKFVIVPGVPSPADPGKKNPWDEVLKNDADKVRVA